LTEADVSKNHLDWDSNDLAGLLELEEVGPWHYRSCFGDPNRNGRAYGGQLLGQTLMAAGYSVPADRHASALQLLFLRGTNPNQPTEYFVTTLQDGKRFSSRHVRGIQAGGIVIDAHVSFQSGHDGPSHAMPKPEGICQPEVLPRLRDLSPVLGARLERMRGYSLDEKPCMDFRIAAHEEEWLAGNVPASAQFWLRSVKMIPTVAHLQEAALAYFSDWWLNFSSLVPHLSALTESQELYIASLNHGLWFYQVPKVHEWLLITTESPIAHRGRGLSLARIYDRSGMLIASASQECLMAANNFISPAMPNTQS
jgi:acyl-CoA thioesterase-2